MTHKLGQVFLHDHNILTKIIDAADVSSEQDVVEIGCGAGIMSEVLADKARHLYIVEIDAACIELTQQRLGERANVTYIHQDVLAYDFSDIPGSFKVVANIPYYISAKIVKHLITVKERLLLAILMTQKEFADKLRAAPGAKDYTSLTVYAGYFFDISYLFSVSKTCFKPVPKVDSAVSIFVPCEDKHVVDPELFFSMVRSLFWARRKPLHSALAKSPYISLQKGFKEVPFIQSDGIRRGETLGFDEMVELYSQIRPFFVS